MASGYVFMGTIPFYNKNYFLSYYPTAGVAFILLKLLVNKSKGRISPINL